MDIKISPSVLACDLAEIGHETIEMQKAGVHMIHLDVMDGHFVPNISFGAPIIKSLRTKTQLHFDTHLMISKPYEYITDFIDAGSDTITFHIESESDALKTIESIKSKGIRAGIALKPNTPAEEAFPYLHLVDMVLVMTVEPGFGGQQFMEDMCPKIARIREYMVENNMEKDIQVDGGIDEITAVPVAKAGANVFVAGSSLFKKADYKQAVSSLQNACEKGFYYKG